MDINSKSVHVSDTDEESSVEESSVESSSYKSSTASETDTSYDDDDDEEEDPTDNIHEWRSLAGLAGLVGPPQLVVPESSVTETDNIFYHPGSLSVILEEPSGFDFTLFEQPNIKEQTSVKTGIQSPSLLLIMKC